MKPKYMINQFLYPTLLFVACLGSCTEDNEISSDNNPLVVEAYLHVNRPAKVIVSNLAGVQAVDVDQLSVSIISNEGIVILASVGDGIYTSDSNDLVRSDAGDYTLKIATRTGEISSLTVVPAKPTDFQLSKTEMTIEPIDFSSGFPFGNTSDESVELSWSNPSDEYYFTFFQNIEDNPELINSALDTIGGNAPMLFFRGEPIQGNSSTIRSSQFQYYGRYHVILFHVNPDYAALYKEQENTSSLNLTSPFTNVVNGLGIFTAIHSDTILFTVKKP
ncbi:MAG: hypothetical protein C0490_10830 [Marivirga sp.]|nr:hypothetical protein [Marivirga sp.]